VRVTNFFIVLYIIILVVACKKNESPPAELCDIWGEGQIFTFSMLDGKTKWSEPFVCTLLGDRLGIQVEHAENRQLWFGIVLDGEKRDRLPGHGTTQFASQENKILASDVIDTKLFIEGIDTRLRLVFADRSTILGQLEVVNNSASWRQVVTECWLQCNQPNVIQENSVVQSTDDKTSSLVFADTLSFEGMHPTRAFIKRKLMPKDTILVDFSYSLFYKPTKQPTFERAAFEQLYKDKLAHYRTLQVHRHKTTLKVQKAYDCK
jgi:hypothetical protein